MPSSKIFRAFWRSSGDVSRPRPHPRRPGPFCGHEERCRLGHGLLLTSERLLQALDFPLVLGAELFRLFLLSRLGKLAGLRLQGENWLVVGILGCLAPAFHLHREMAPLAAVGAELSGVEASGLQHHRELVGGTPTLRIFLGGRHHFPLQPPGLPPFVEGDRVDAQLL